MHGVMSGEPIWPNIEVPPDDLAIVEAVTARYGMRLVRAIFGLVNHVYLLHPSASHSDYPEGITAKIPVAGSTESQPHREVTSLELLHELPNPPLQLPQLLEFDESTGTRIFATLPGMTETGRAISDLLGPPALYRFGKRVGRLHAWQEGLKPEHFIERLRAVGANPSSGFETSIAWLRTFDHPSTPTLTRTVANELEKIRSHRPDGMHPANKVVHMDCRPENVLCRQLPDRSYAPTGYIDHEALSLGDSESSMRFWPIAGSAVLDGCIDGYREATGVTLNREVIVHWARLQALLVAAGQVSRGVPRFRTLRTAYINLQYNLLPDTDWHELLNPGLVYANTESPANLELWRTECEYLAQIASINPSAVRLRDIT